MTSVKTTIPGAKHWLLYSGNGWVNLICYPHNALFFPCAVCEGGSPSVVIKRLVCRRKGNNLTGASQSVTLSAPFKNQTLPSFLLHPLQNKSHHSSFITILGYTTHFCKNAVISCADTIAQDGIRYCMAVLREIKSLFWVFF